MNEQQIEQNLITKLKDLKYTHRPDIRDRVALPNLQCQTFRPILLAATTKHACASRRALTRSGDVTTQSVTD